MPLRTRFSALASVYLIAWRASRHQSPLFSTYLARKPTPPAEPQRSQIDLVLPAIFPIWCFSPNTRTRTHALMSPRHSQKNARLTYLAQYARTSIHLNARICAPWISIATSAAFVVLTLTQMRRIPILPAGIRSRPYGMPRISAQRVTKPICPEDHWFALATRSARKRTINVWRLTVLRHPYGPCLQTTNPTVKPTSCKQTSIRRDNGNSYQEPTDNSQSILHECGRIARL